MTLWFVMTCLFGLWIVRLTAVNNRLRKRDPWDQAWQNFQRRQSRTWREIERHARRNPRHPSAS